MSKATQESAVTETKSQQSTGSVSGGFQGKMSGVPKRRLLIAGAVAVVLLGLVSYGIYHQIFPSVQTVKTPYNGPTDFYLMDPAEVPANVEPVLGVSENDLKTKTLTSLMLPKFEKSYGAAKALVMLKEPKKALEAMKLAEGQVAVAKLDYAQRIDFHYNYAGIALKNSNKSLAKQQIGKARKILDEAKVDAELKKSQYRQLRYFEEELELL